MSLLVLADDLAGSGIQRGKQAGRAMARVVMGAAFDLAGSHGLSHSNWYIKGRALQ